MRIRFLCSAVRRTARHAALAAAVTVLPAGAMAQDLFTITVDAQGDVITDSFDDVTDFFDALDSGQLETVFPNYSGTAAADVTANFRGVDLLLIYPDAGETVVFEVPAIGLTETFDLQGTREGNEDDLETFLEENEDNILTQILQTAVSETANDPVAGNPNSLQGQFVSSDFNVGTAVGTGNSFETSGPEAAAEGDDAPNLIGFGARLGRFTADGVDTTIIELPLNYTIPLSDPRYAISIDVPLSYAQIDGLDSFAASLGVGFRVPVFDNWYVTPALRIGGTGSFDLGSAAVLYSASVTSNFSLDLGPVDVSVGNLLSYVSTAPFELTIDDTSIDYDLQNFITRNGVEVGGGTPYEVFGQPLTWEVSAVNTQIFGDDVFIDNYFDFAVSVGTQASQNRLTWDSLRLGVTYTVATNEDYQGFRVNFGYQF